MDTDNILVRRKTAWTFTAIENEIITNQSLNPTEKMTYITLCMFSDKEKVKTVYPSLTTLSKYLGVSRNTVIKTIKSLEDNNYLHIERRPNDSNIYTLLSPEIEEITVNSASANSALVQILHHSASANSEPPLVQILNPNKNNLNKNKINNKNNENITANAVRSNTLFDLPKQEKEVTLSRINKARLDGVWKSVTTTDYVDYFVEQHNKLFLVKIDRQIGKEGNYLVKLFRTNFIERYSIPASDVCDTIDKILQIYKETTTDPKYRDSFDLSAFKQEWIIDKLMQRLDDLEEYGANQSRSAPENKNREIF